MGASTRPCDGDGKLWIHRVDRDTNAWDVDDLKETIMARYSDGSQSFLEGKYADKKRRKRNLFIRVYVRKIPDQSRKSADSIIVGDALF